MRTLQGGDAATARTMLETLTRQEPKSAPAWRALGSAYQQLHEPRLAIAAYQRALALEPDSPQVFYSLGATYAGLHDATHAFEWLGRARASRRYDLTQATQDKNLDSLRGDPRFAQLLPRPEDFAQPFVEPVTILREWRGEAANDQFGWIARNIGDVDGDGIADCSYSAPTHGAGGDAGRCTCTPAAPARCCGVRTGARASSWAPASRLPGTPTATASPTWSPAARAPAASRASTPAATGACCTSSTRERAEETFGNHVAGAGDVDGDGYADIIVGSPGKDGEHKSPGHAYVYSGRTGALLLTLSGERDGDQFGSTVAGYADARQHYLVVGAPLAGAAHHGRVYVYGGSAPALKFTIEADATGNALGLMFVSVPGDMDGDGVSEIFASDWSNDAHGLSTGRVYVYSGRTGQTLCTFTGETCRRWLWHQRLGGRRCRRRRARRPDRRRLAVRAGGRSGGRAYLYSGRDGHCWPPTPAARPGDTFGFDAAGLGDVNGDGTSALLITSGWSGVHGFHSGRVFVIASGLPARVTPSSYG